MEIAHLDVVTTKHKERSVFCFILTLCNLDIWNTVEGTLRAVNQPICGLKYVIIVFHLY